MFMRLSCFWEQVIAICTEVKKKPLPYSPIFPYGTLIPFTR